MKRIALASLVLGAACGGRPAPAASPPTSPAPASSATAPSAAAPPPGASSAAAASEADRAFWDWFVAHAAALRAEPALPTVMETVSARIEAIHPGVFAEIGDGATRTLVISADGQRELFPAVQALYAARPAAVPGWTIVAFRQRDPSPDLVIEMGDVTLDPATMRFVAREHDGMLDVAVFVPGFTSREAMAQPLYIVLDHTVGEYDMETKIAGIDVAPIEQAPAGARPLRELPALLDRLPAR